MVLEARRSAHCMTSGRDFALCAQPLFEQLEVSGFDRADVSSPETRQPRERADAGMGCEGTAGAIDVEAVD